MNLLLYLKESEIRKERKRCVDMRRLMVLRGWQGLKTGEGLNLSLFHSMKSKIDENRVTIIMKCTDKI